MTNMDVLEEARVSGNAVTIIYHGGSQPGTYREILVLAFRDNLVVAKCLRSMRERTFASKKIEVVPENFELKAKPWDPLQKKNDKYKSIAELYGSKVRQFEAWGWHINLEENTLSLHRRFKNGRPLKTPDISLTYSEYIWDEVFDGVEFFQENHRQSTRPWTLRGKGKTSRSYGKLSSAARTFLEWAHDMAPTK